MLSEVRQRFVDAAPDWLYGFVATYYWMLHPRRERVFLVSKSGSWLLVRKDGSKIFSPKSRLNPRPMPYERYFEVSPNEIVLDVGACIGEFTIPAAKKAKKVIAIEASPENVRWLRNNVSLNDLRNVLVAEKAAWSSKKNLKLYLDKKNIGGHSLVNKKSEESIQVQADTLDNIVSDLKVSRVDFIKIDVEGAEPEVLSGAENILKECKKIVIESHIREGKMTISRIRKILRKHFDVCFISLDGRSKLVYALKSDIKS